MIPFSDSFKYGNQVNIFSIKVFDSEEAAIDAVLADEVVDGDVVVVRYVGPKGGPGMPEMLSLSSIIVGKGQGDKVAF